MTEATPESPPAVVVPHTQISAAALRSLIESFVLREGTDYGGSEVEFDVKTSQVLRQLERGEAQILYDPNTQSVDIVRTPGR